MTAKELQEVQDRVRHNDSTFVDDDPQHDRYGYAKDHNTFDARNTEDVFPY